MKVKGYETFRCDAGWRTFSFLKLVTDTGPIDLPTGAHRIELRTGDGRRAAATVDLLEGELSDLLGVELPRRLRLRHVELELEIGGVRPLRRARRRRAAMREPTADQVDVAQQRPEVASVGSRRRVSLDASSH